MERMEKTINTAQRVPQIHLYDGYQNEPFWRDDANSTYYNYQIDKQCKVPIRSLEQVKKELGISK